MRIRALPVFLAFFVMGFVDSVGALVAYVREQYALSGTTAGLLPFAGFLAFALVSVPAGIVVARRGKRFVLLAALGIVLAGELLPLVGVARYAWLLAAIFLIGVGMAALQVAGNPIMRDVSPPGAYARNLTLAQFVKSLGSNAAPYLLPFVLYLGWGWTAMFAVFAAVAAVNLLLASRMRIDESPVDGPPATVASSLALLREPGVAPVVLGIFLYVGAEVGLNSWIATHLEGTFDMPLADATRSLGLFLGGLAVGRLLGSAVLTVVPPRRFLIAAAAAGTLAVAGILAPSRPVVLGSVLLAGLAFSNVWPLIFAIAIDERPGRAGELSGLMCMAIFGGALLPLVMGRVADVVSVRAAFLAPLACFVYLLALALFGARRAAAAA